MEDLIGRVEREMTRPLGDVSVITTSLAGHSVENDDSGVPGGTVTVVVRRSPDAMS